MGLATDMKVEILSPEKIIFRGEASSLGLPGKLGGMTILPCHTPMIAELGVGTVELGEVSGGKNTFFIASGFLEVIDGNARVLVDVVEKPADIDVDRARKAEKRAKDRLSSTDLTIDFVRAGEALKRAQTRISLATK